MKKILIIGRNSFIGTSLKKYLKNKFYIHMISFENFKQKNEIYLKKFNFLINCSINKTYINKKYNKKFDFDLYISEKIKKLQIKQIFLSTRKVYMSNSNIKEYSQIKTSCNYSKNKFITEKKLTKLLNKKLLILRISNLIGLKNINSKRKLHYKFIDMFIDNAKKGIIFENKNIYKDFLPVSKFNKIVELMIKKDLAGIFNISLGKKVYLTNLIKWLNYYNKKTLITAKFK